MIPKAMTDLMDFHHELVNPDDPTSWKDPGGVRLFRLVDQAETRALKKVPLTKEEGIEIVLALERELWKAREEGVWDEDQDYEKFIRWNEVVLSGIGACPICNCGEVNAEIEKRRASDPEIVAHFKKVGVDLPAILREHRA